MSPRSGLGLSSLQATLDKLGRDEDRHKVLIQELTRRMALPATQLRHVKKSFAESGYVLVKTIGQGRFGMVKMGKKKANAYTKFTSRAAPTRERSKTTMHSGFIAVRIIPRFRMVNNKVVMGENFSSQEKYKSLMMQIEALRSLDHPHICREYETFEDDQNIYIIMELYTGGQLLDREEGPMPERRVADVMSQLLGAAAHAHERQIVHQDIRPENILYASADVDSRIVLCDWSCSSFIDTPEEDSRRALVFSEFSAPELDFRSRTDRGDVWSLGAIAFALLTLEFPFNDVAKEDFSWGAGYQELSRSCRDFVEQLMRFNPRERPSAREALNHTWLQEAKSMSRPSVPTTMLSNMASNLVKFKNQNLARKAAATYAAVHLSGDKLHQLTKAFEAIDANGDGFIDQAELADLLRKQVEARKYGGEESDSGDEDVQLASQDDSSMFAVLSALDVDGSGKVQYTEFLAAAASALMEDSVQLCWEAFRGFDVDGDGQISKAELTSVLHTPQAQELIQRLQASSSADPALTNALEALGGVPETARQLLERLDKDSSGAVSFPEFVEVMFGQVVEEDSIMLQNQRRRSSLPPGHPGRRPSQAPVVQS